MPLVPFPLSIDTNSCLSHPCLVSTDIATDPGEHFKHSGSKLISDQAGENHHIPGNLQDLVHDTSVALLDLERTVSENLPLVAACGDGPDQEVANVSGNDGR